MRLSIARASLALLSVALGSCAGGAAPRESRAEATGGSSSSGGGASGGSAPTITVDGGPVANPCESQQAPDECELVPSGPACGDKQRNQDSEECDDGNSLPGDGCSGVCKIESHFVCPEVGSPCVSTIVCGDGALGPGEACDDGNRAEGDGCAPDCRKVAIGYACRVEGEACVRVYVCGDGSVDPNEGCDDGNVTEGDGCDARCRLELGFKCQGAPSACTATVCGDKIVEGAESCDDGNQQPFDGCGGSCRAEPDCTGAACMSSCGDGIVLGEDCDDGNLRDGDGCSSSCKVEEGHRCVNPECELDAGQCTLRVPAVFRDFKPAGAAGGHPDFEPLVNRAVVTPGLVRPELDAEGKPIYSGAAPGTIASVASFQQWYRDTPNVNTPVVSELVLWSDGAGGFVNRWGANGEKFVGFPGLANPRPAGAPAYSHVDWCSNTGCDDPACAPVNPLDRCFFPCLPWNNQAQACLATTVEYEGNPVFFPIDQLAGADAARALIAPAYGWNWATEQPKPPATVAPLHNFHFTTEVKYWFRFDAATTARLDFTGDDDVWVFVNGRLAVDLGGWHAPLDGSVSINAATAATYGLTAGNVYPISVFHAERKKDGSSFRLTLSGFNLAPSDCGTDCGDGMLAAGEQCDDGPKNLGGYNQCTPTCALGPRCGDAVLQSAEGERCDAGTAQNDGSYGGCAPNCQLGPHCGDSVVQADREQCDDGTNAGGYGECSPGCVLGPHCGDGKITKPNEDCDDANNVDRDGCSAACRLEVVVPK